MVAIGNLAFALAPFVLGHGSGGYAASTLQSIGWTFARALPVAVGLASWRVPSGPPMPSGRISLRAALNSARGNHPLHWYASIFLLTNLGQGVFYGLVFLYVSSVLGLAAAFVWVVLADAVVTLAAIPLWYALVRALEKPRAWALEFGRGSCRERGGRYV